MLIDEYPVETIRTIIAESKEKTAVDYNSKDGGVCPLCGRKKCSVRNVGKWSGSLRERYHSCQDCNHSFKSVEVAPD